MSDFIKKNIYLIILFIITLSIGFLTFLTFIDKGFIELTDKNLQYLLVINIILLLSFFVFIFFEIKKAIRTDINIVHCFSTERIAIIGFNTFQASRC